MNLFMLALYLFPGQAVKKDQLIAEVETSKALLEIDAQGSGYSRLCSGKMVHMR